MKESQIFQLLNDYSEKWNYFFRLLHMLHLQPRFNDYGHTDKCYILVKDTHFTLTLFQPLGLTILSSHLN